MKKIISVALSISCLACMSATAQNVSQPREIYLRGVGTIGTQGHSIYMLDGKRITQAEFAALDSTVVENINFNHTSDAELILTPEEVAQGVKSVIAVTSKSNPFAGEWLLVSENGQPQKGWSKTYGANGVFSVNKFKKMDAHATHYLTEQRGLWQESDGVITEQCSMGNKGMVTIGCKFVGDTLVQTFSYPAAPETQYVQKFVREGQCGGTKHMKVSTVTDDTMRVAGRIIVEPTPIVPQYPGGEGEMYRYFACTLRYPVQAAEQGIWGKVFVTFVVGADGKISDARVVRKVSPMLDSEALRAVQGLKPFEVPSEYVGEAGAKRYILPVNFVLADNTDIDTKEVRLDENIGGEYLDEVVVMGAK